MDSRITDNLTRRRSVLNLAPTADRLTDLYQAAVQLLLSGRIMVGLPNAIRSVLMPTRPILRPQVCGHGPALRLPIARLINVALPHAFLGPHGFLRARLLSPLARRPNLTPNQSAFQTGGRTVALGTASRDAVRLQGRPSCPAVPWRFDVPLVSLHPTVAFPPNFGHVGQRRMPLSKLSGASPKCLKLSAEVPVLPETHRNNPCFGQARMKRSCNQRLQSRLQTRNQK